MLWVNFTLSALAVFLLVPLGVLCAECVAAILPRRKIASGDGASRPSLAILIPAHNEEVDLSHGLRALMPQLRNGDRVLVVADNCEDATADIARQHGAQVVERHDKQLRGKGYALDYGMRVLEASPPDVLVMMDADCYVHPGALDALADQVMATGRPAQARYLLERPARAGAKDLVSALAFLVKNWVRPCGLGRFGLPCLLTGTGMAFPWELARSAKLASGNIVEDMQLGIDLTIAGHSPLFCGDARVTGRLPDTDRVALGQRTRWEHGHLRTLLTQAPRLLKASVTQFRIAPLALALELSVPPLSLLVMGVAAGLSLLIPAWMLGASRAPLGALLAGAIMAGLGILAAWVKFGRHTLPLRSLLAAPFYVAWKIPMYFAFVLKPQKEWVRTARTVPNQPAEAETSEQPALALAGIGSGGDMAYRDGFELPPAGFSFKSDLNRDHPLPYPAGVKLGSAEVHAVTESSCIQHILDRLEAGQGGMMVRPNVDHLRQCWREDGFAQLVASADLVVADGMPLLWNSRLQGTPLPAPIAGSDLIWNLLAAAELSERSVFLLGDDVHATADAGRRIKEKHPAVVLAGQCAVPAGVDLHSALAAACADPVSNGALNASAGDCRMLESLAASVVEKEPDLIFVALESPLQEQLIQYLRPRLPKAWWLGVGTSFSFLCGDARRAPVWMRTSGLDWSNHLAAAPPQSSRTERFDNAPEAAEHPAAAAVQQLARLFNKFDTVRALNEGGDGGTDGGANAIPSPEAAAVEEPRVLPSVVIDVSKSSPPPGLGLEQGGNLIYQSFVSGFTQEFAPAGPMLVPSFPPGSDGLEMLGHLREVVLLGGNVRRSGMTRAIERSLLDLPLEDGRSLLWHWRDHAIDLRRFIGLESLPVRVLVDQRSVRPTAPPRGSHVVVRVERDLLQYRGTGGVLRDLTDSFADDDVILVANAAQSLLAPLPDLAAAMAERGGDVCLVWHDDGTPSGVMLFRCAALRLIAGSGYVDLKEQALPLIATKFNVRHLPQTYPTALPIRTLGEYITALQHRYRQRLGRPAPANPFAEDCRPTFAIIEEGAAISAEARIHDSVVLRGACVEAGALVVRSIICPGAVVGAGDRSIDQLVTADALLLR